MSQLTRYREFIHSIKSRLGFWNSYSILQFTGSMGRIMRAEKVSGKKLAKLLGVSPQQVSKVLNGNENITIETMTKFADALDSVIYIHVAKKGVSVQWVEGDAANIGAESLPVLGVSGSSEAPIQIQAPTAEDSDFVSVH